MERRPDHGFTLLETMVALAILGLTVVALLQLISGASGTTARDRATTTGLALAEQRLEALLTIGADEALRADGEESAFAPPFERYRSRVRVARVPGRDLVEVRVEVRWDGVDAGAVVLATRALATAGPGVGS